MLQDTPLNQDQNNNYQKNINKNYNPNIFKPLIVVILILACITGYLVYDKFYLKSSLPQTTNLNSVSKTETELLSLIKTQYLREYPDSKKIDDYKNKGLVSSLGDPYSEYITSTEEKEFNNNLNQKYKGIGIKLEKLDSSFLVMGVVPNSPALEQGVQKGDIIVKIEDMLITNQSTEVVVNKIRGEENTPVKIQFARNGQLIDITMNRREIKSDLIKLDIKDKFAIITISSFGEGLDTKMQEFAKTIVSNPVIEKIIVDVRSDGGGLMSGAIDILGYFVPTGTVALQEVGKNSDGTMKTTANLTTDKESNLLKYPVIVLTDTFSASSSEILAGALRDHRQAKIYGQRTFGKGVVQKIFPISNGDYVKLTIAQWLTPKGVSIDKNGITPDVITKTSEDALTIAMEQNK